MMALCWSNVGLIFQPISDRYLAGLQKYDSADIVIRYWPVIQNNIGPILVRLNMPAGYCKSLATSSIREYNRKLTLFKNFCTNSGTEDLSGSEAVGLIPSFLISVAKKSERPDSALRTCTAALQHFYVARANLDPINQNIHRLIKGLVRGETNRPREDQVRAR